MIFIKFQNKVRSGGSGNFWRQILGPFPFFLTQVVRSNRHFRLRNVRCQSIKSLSTSEDSVGKCLVIFKRICRCYTS